jgi:8-oxo-dGTP pyrophosphatase MutT (NUDIX family)
MLYFYCPPADADLDALASHGVPVSPDEPVRVHLRLQDALDAAEDGPVLVVDDQALPDLPTRVDTHQAALPALPAAAIQNVAPYHPPVAILAGGGYVACPLDGEAVALLVIFRRGAWDLPKGKQDPGESVEACALREVCEEVGIDRLRTVRPLGTTQHGYVRDNRYEVKTTHWFLMRTPERSFDPERREGIERVAWAQWPVAYRHLGYDTLRRHMDRCEADVRAALRADGTS